MNNLLDNKTILVAGAGGLLGTSLVETILNQGARVIAADFNVEQMVTRLDSLGVNIQSSNFTSLELDITNEESVKALFDDDSLVIDGAVNATYPRNKTYGKHFFEVSFNEFNENLSLHLGSAFLFTQQCAAYFMRKKTPFSLVNVSSIYGVIAPKFEIYENTSMTMPVEYAAIKSALILLSKYVAKYVCDSKFRVNLVSPGGIFDHQPSGFLNAYGKETFGKGMLAVSDVVGSIVFLLSSSSDYVNGQNLVVDDGFSM